MNSKPKNQIKISVAIVAFNEEKRLPKCLESLFFADEIVLVDSGSNDKTVEIAKKYGCKVIFRKWLGYAKQKQFAVDNCKNRWVFIIDADEVVSDAAKDKIKEIIREYGDKYAGFSLMRKAFFHGKWIRRCGWWPDRVLRIVDRQKGGFSNDLVHERWISRGPVKELDLVIDHYSFGSYSDMLDKVQRYSDLAAKDMHEKGKKAYFWTPGSRGLWMFFRAYFLELGFMDGFDGFMISFMTALVSFMKYAKLMEYDLSQKPGK